MAAESSSPAYDVVVVGGGPAGTTTALYTTRLGHDTVVFEKAGGRHAGVAHVHNLYGVSEDVSGQELSDHATDQLVEYGGDVHRTAVTDVRREGDGEARFVVETDDGAVSAGRVVFATGFTDVGPDIPELAQFTGRGLHYCLHCDAYGLGDAPAYVLGHDDHAASVATVLLNVTADVDLLLDGRDPTWDEETERQLAAHPVEIVVEPVVEAFPDDDPADEPGDGPEDEPWLGGLRFADGTERRYRGGFAMYGTDYETELAAGLGCRLADDGALAVDERHETSVDGAYAVGDVTHGQNQTAIALGDGARAGIAVHKDLRRYPRPAGEPVDPSSIPAASDGLRHHMQMVRQRESHAGLRGPPPGG